VENHGHVELGAEMSGISGDDGKCLGRRAAFKKNFAERVAEIRAQLAPDTPVKQMRVGQKNKLTYR
jgi:hypothetical protein